MDRGGLSQLFVIGLAVAAVHGTPMGTDSVPCCFPAATARN